MDAWVQNGVDLQAHVSPALPRQRGGEPCGSPGSANAS